MSVVLSPDGDPIDPIEGMGGSGQGATREGKMMTRNRANTRGLFPEGGHGIQSRKGGGIRKLTLGGEIKNNNPCPPGHSLGADGNCIMG